MQTGQLLVARHARVTRPTDSWFDGQGDSTRIGVEGIGEAQRLAQYVEQNYTVNTIYASDLRRASDTARIVAETLALPLILSEELREIDYGYANGMEISEFLAKFPERHQGLYATRDMQYDYGSGESRQAGYERMRAFIDYIVAKHAGETIFIVGHLLTLALLLSGILEGKAESWWNCRMDTAALTEVLVSTDEARLMMFNHLPAFNSTKRAGL